MMKTENLHKSDTPLSSVDLEEENRRLQGQIDTLLQYGYKNQQILSRNHELSLNLIGTDTLADLIRHVFTTMKNTAQLDVISMILLDSKGTLNHLMKTLNIHSNEYPHLFLTADLTAFHSSLASLTKPTLGAYCPHFHRGLFTAAHEPPQSVAVIPFYRHHRLTGFICLGSMDAHRFATGMATDFLQLQGSIIAICLENVVTQERIKQISLSDPLTGLGNRRHLEEQTVRELSLARRNNTTLSCLFIDIDKFKLINDTLGHPAGDEVLKELAQRIRKELRVHDIPARFGGEEFVLILPDTDMPEARNIAERIRLAVCERPFALPNKEYCDISISIGGYSISNIALEQNLADLCHFTLSQADLALYEAKETGRNKVVWARPR